jgi:hypothetical protein
MEVHGDQSVFAVGSNVFAAEYGGFRRTVSPRESHAGASDDLFKALRVDFLASLTLAKDAVSLVNETIYCHMLHLTLGTDDRLLPHIVLGEIGLGDDDVRACTPVCGAVGSGA